MEEKNEKRQNKNHKQDDVKAKDKAPKRTKAKSDKSDKPAKLKDKVEKSAKPRREKSAREEGREKSRRGGLHFGRLAGNGAEESHTQNAQTENGTSRGIGRDYQLDDVASVGEDEGKIEGRNAVTEAFRAGRTIDRLYVLDGCQDGPVLTIKRMAAKAGTPIKYLSRQRLDQLSETGRHQGVIAVAAAYHYSTMDDLFRKAEEKGEDPFFIILDDIEDPHNLGAIIRTANVVGADGVIIPKDRAVGLTATVAKASAGALNFTPVVKVTNLSQTIEDLKKKGMWFVCADMDGTPMTKLNLTGPIGLVIGAEGNGVSRLVKENCDIVASIPMKGEINSLNASVAAGVLMYEILRQRTK